METLKVCEAVVLNMAVTDLDEVINTVQGLLDPLQAPVHVEKKELPDEALA